MKTNADFLRSNFFMLVLILPVAAASCGEKPAEPTAPQPTAPTKAPSVATPAGQESGRPAYQGSDKELASKVKGALRADRDHLSAGIDVTVTNGTAHLWGTVGRTAERLRAEDIARSIDGVTSVDNRLLVESGS